MGLFTVLGSPRHREPVAVFQGLHPVLSRETKAGWGPEHCLLVQLCSMAFPREGPSWGGHATPHRCRMECHCPEKKGEC
jgi:hypothetical protein